MGVNRKLPQRRYDREMDVGEVLTALSSLALIVGVFIGVLQLRDASPSEARPTRRSPDARP